jgi:hypothetical protein
MMMPSHLKWILALALLVSVLPAEGSRRHSFEAPASVRTAPQRDEEPRRGLFGAFGRDDESEQHQVVRLADGEKVEMDERMIEAMHLAERGARSRSIHRCWRYVKRALQAADVVECYPQTALAKQAAVELPNRYGFERLDVDDPFEAPVGSVLVYGGRGAGHVEFRTKTGFVSDHASRKPSPRPLIGVFIKPVEG